MSDSKFFLASVVDSLQDPVVTIDLDGYVTTWNKAAEQLYGYSAGEIIGQPLSRVHVPKEMVEKMELIRSGATPNEYGSFQIQRNGSLLQLDTTLSPIQNDAGVVIGLSIISRDVSALRNAEEAFAGSESRLRAVVDAATDFSIIMLDEGGMIVDWNSGAELMFGYSKEEAIGQHTALIFTEEDRHANIPMVEIETAKREGRSFDERWHIRKDGVRFFMSGVLTPVRQRNLGGYVKITRNISDRKLAEEALMLSEQQKSLAMQSAEMGEWEWDGGNFITISKQVAMLLGMPAEEKKAFTSELVQRIYPGDQEKIRQGLQQALGGLNIFQCECQIVRADNQQVKWVNMYGRVVRHDSDRPPRMIGVLYDITPRKLLEKQKDDFISVASHELKTPITAIRVFNQILLENLAASRDEANATLVRKIDTQVDRLITLVKNLLDTSMLSEGQMKLQPQGFDLNEAIEEQLDALRSIAVNHTVNWKPNPVAVIHADRERIMQVVTNFVSNAAKYSPDQTEIVVATEDKLDGLKLTVTDKGMGIPEKAQQFVFDRYYRGQHSSDNKGFGLGLYICLQIIRQHHGTIGLTSAVGEGSSFWFTLPYS